MFLELFGKSVQGPFRALALRRPRLRLFFCTKMEVVVVFPLCFWWCNLFWIFIKFRVLVAGEILFPSTFLTPTVSILILCSPRKRWAFYLYSSSHLSGSPEKIDPARQSRSNNPFYKGGWEMQRNWFTGYAVNIVRLCILKRADNCILVLVCVITECSLSVQALIFADEDTDSLIRYSTLLLAKGSWSWS